MTNLFYKNRRLLVLAICLIMVGGTSSFLVMPRMEDPSLVPRAANILTILPGRDAEAVEALVTKIIEDEVYEIDEIKEVRSISQQGVSLINVELRDDVIESEKVWSRIRDKVDNVRPQLPRECQDPEFIDLDFKAYAMIVAVKWTLDGPANYAILRRHAEYLKEQIKLVPGTEKVELFGDPAEEVLVEVDHDQALALGLTVSEVARQIAASDAKLAAGLVRSGSNELLVEMDTQLERFEEIGQLPIRTSRSGQIVQLADIARIQRNIVEPSTDLAIVDGQPAVALGLFNRGVSRIDIWSAATQARFQELAGQLPAGIELTEIYNQNRYVSQRLSSLLGNLLLGSLAVSLVIMVMMGWRNALIVVSALPLAGCMVLTGLRMMEIPIHQMSITGLIIAIGLLIDNAIVMVDEVSFKMREGQGAARAISSCVRHMFVPLLGSTLTTALAFGPIALMPGPAGEFVGSIAISVILAVFSSLFLAMTVIPTLAAIISPFQKSDERGRDNGRGSENDHGTEPSREPASHSPNEDRITQASWWQAGITIPALRKLFERNLEVILRYPVLGLLAGILLPLGGFFVVGQLPEQFFPSADRDQIQIEMELPALTHLDRTLELTQRVREKLLENDRVTNVDWFLGKSAPSFYYNVIPRRENSAQFAQAIVSLDSAKDLPALIRELQQVVDHEFPEARTLVRQLEQGPPFDAPVEVRLFGPDLETLRSLGDEVRQVLVETPGVIHTRCDLAEAAPALRLGLDEQQIRMAGLDPQDVANQLNAALEGAAGGNILEATEELPIRVRLAKNRRKSVDDLLNTQVLAANRLLNESNRATFDAIPVSAFAQADLEPQFATITHLSGRRLNEIQAFIPAGVLPAEILVPFKERIAAANIEFPPGYYLEYGGESAKRDEAVGNLMSSVSILMVLMVATLVLSFGSFRLAAVIGFVAVLSIGLGVGALWLFGFPFGFMAIVGTMGLIGVAINDSIVVLAAIREDELARAGDIVSMRKVVVRCSRHIISTSLTTMAGFLPLILGGGGFWPPLAVAIAGGVGGATIIALLLAPSAYLLVMHGNWRQWIPAQLLERALNRHVVPAPNSAR